MFCESVLTTVLLTKTGAPEETCQGENGDRTGADKHDVLSKGTCLGSTELRTRSVGKACQFVYGTVDDCLVTDSLAEYRE